MIDVEKQVQYWRESAAEDWEIAQALVATNKNRHGLFYAFLAIEKMLKMIILKRTRDLPPKIHNLIGLCELAELTRTYEQSNALAKLNVFEREGLYPEISTSPLTAEKTRRYMKSADELIRWLRACFGLTSEAL